MKIEVGRHMMAAWQLGLKMASNESCRHSSVQRSQSRGVGIPTSDNKKMSAWVHRAQRVNRVSRLRSLCRR